MRCAPALIALAAAACPQVYDPAGLTRRDCADLDERCPNLRLTWVGPGCGDADGGCRPASRACDFVCPERCRALLDDDGMPVCAWMDGRCMVFLEKEYERVANRTKP